jgi:uncharacterized membrane protein (DUF2068 family)
MERPQGVTVLACLYFFIAFAMLIALVPSQTFNPLQQPGLLAWTAGNLIIGVTLGVALLRMKSWSRWLAIIASASNLLLVPHEVAAAHTTVALIRAGLRIVFVVCVIWYLTRPQVRAAFRNS